MEATVRIALIALALVVGTPTMAAAQEPFDFKGIALGITLEEMRATRADDPRAANANVVCTGDPEVGPISYLEVHLSEAETAAGIRRCAYFDQPRYPGLSQLAYLGIGSDWAAVDYEFDFFPDPATGGHRLFRIALVTNVGARRFVYDALTEKFGSPDDLSSEPVQNRMGASFERAVMRWNRPNATLTVTAPSSRLDRMSVIYRLTDLSQAANAAARDAQSADPNRM